MVKALKQKHKHWKEIVEKHGAEILESENMLREKQFKQHGNISVYSHSKRVAVMSLLLADLLCIRVNRRAMLRGALLHDYFLYDWHDKDPSHRLHGFSHADTALKNASRDFELDEIEKDVIRSHMFPLNLRPPKYRESIMVCVADKISALDETVRGRGKAE